MAIYLLRLILAIIHICTKFDLSIASALQLIWGGPKFPTRVTWPGPRPFEGHFILCRLVVTVPCHTYIPNLKCLALADKQATKPGDLTHNWLCLSLYHCQRFAKKTKKKKKKDSGKLDLRTDHPYRWIIVKVCMSGGLQCVVLLAYIKFY